MAGISRVAMGQILGAYVVLLLFGLGVHYGAAQGSPLGVLFMVVSVSSVPFLLNGPAYRNNTAATSLVHPKHAEGTSGGSPRRGSAAAGGRTSPPSEKDKRRRRRKHQPKLVDLWHDTESLRHSEVRDGIGPPPRTPLVIRDMCAPSPDDALIVPNARTPVQFTNEVCPMWGGFRLSCSVGYKYIQRLRNLADEANNLSKLSSQNFSGCALMKFKTYPDDPYYKPYFDGKRRLFEIQVSLSAVIVFVRVTYMSPRVELQTSFVAHFAQRTYCCLGARSFPANERE